MVKGGLLCLTSGRCQPPLVEKDKTTVLFTGRCANIEAGIRFALLHSAGLAAMMASYSVSSIDCRGFCGVWICSRGRSPPGRSVLGAAMTRYVVVTSLPTPVGAVSYSLDVAVIGVAATSAKKTYFRQDLLAMLSNYS
jgi:hypothetical protein